MDRGASLGMSSESFHMRYDEMVVLIGITAVTVENFS
jgi:hypothetical protein